MRAERRADRREAGKQRDRFLAVEENLAQPRDVAAQRIGMKIIARLCSHGERGEPEIELAVQLGGGKGVDPLRQDQGRAIEARRFDPLLRLEDATPPGSAVMREGFAPRLDLDAAIAAEAPEHHAQRALDRGQFNRRLRKGWPFQRPFAKLVP